MVKMIRDIKDKVTKDRDKKKVKKPQKKLR